MSLLVPTVPINPSAQARSWIMDRPVGSWFRSQDVPGPRSVVRTVLSRLLHSDRPCIARAAHSIYWRRDPDNPTKGPDPLVGHAQSVLAPPGSSLADHCALNYIGWSTQVPYRTTMAIPYRNLTAPSLPEQCPVTFSERHNLRRRELNWNEANLLEAVRCGVKSNYHNWDAAMLPFGWAKGWMKPGVPIRKHVFLWAAETETPDLSWDSYEGYYTGFRRTLERLSRDLPDTVVFP